MYVLVTGAAGQAGHRAAVHPEARFIQADLADTDALNRVF